MGKERIIISQDWIILVFALCLFLITAAKIFSRTSIADLLTAYVSDRFINISRTNSDGFIFLKIASLLVYALCIAFLVYALLVNKSVKPATLNTYFLSLLGVSVFLLLKHYLGKLLASILDFEPIMEYLHFHRNIYRSMLSYLVLVSSILLFIVFKTSLLATIYIGGLCLCIILVYDAILLYTHRHLLLSRMFYFILYLCTLEIIPYLLLFKYFRNVTG